MAKCSRLIILLTCFCVFAVCEQDSPVTESVNAETRTPQSLQDSTLGELVSKLVTNDENLPTQTANATTEEASLRNYEEPESLQGLQHTPVIYSLSSTAKELMEKSEELSANEGEVEERTEDMIEDADMDDSTLIRDSPPKISEHGYRPPSDVQLPRLIQHPESSRTLKHATPAPVSRETITESELHYLNADEETQTTADEIEIESGKVVSLNPEIQFFTTSTTTEPPNTLESLRTFLEDIYLRGPIAILVDVDQDNLAKTRDMWNSMEAIDGIMKLTDVLLVGYDNDGITWMSHHRGTGSQRLEYEAKSFRKALYGLRSSSKDIRPGDPGPVLARTVRLLPYDSAIFLFCKDDDEDFQYSGDSTFPAKLQKMLLAKRMKLYTVSESKRWSSTARASGGASLSIPETEREHQRDLRALNVYYDSSDEDELEFEEQQTIVLKSGLSQDQSLAIPVDSSIKIMTIMISEKPQLAMLYGPDSIRIDLLDAASIRNFSYGSDIKVQDGKVNVRLSMNQNTVAEEQSEPHQGIWRLTIRNDNSSVPYEVEVKAETTVRVMARVTPSYAYDRMGGNKIKIAVGGTVASVREAIIVDRQGQKIARLPYRYREGSASSESDSVDIESLRAMESGTLVKEVPIPKELPSGLPFYIQVTGRNDKDEQFVRISQEIRVLLFDPEVEELPTMTTVTAKTHEHQVMAISETPQVLGRGLSDIEPEQGVNYNMSRQLQVTRDIDGLIPLTSLQIGASSRLWGAPGSQMQIQFEVTNHRENAVYYRFGAKDEKYYLRTMSPLRQWINAKQTANVILTVGITTGAESSARDLITFTASGLEQSTLDVYLYVETDGRISADRSRPSLRHDFRGDCMGYLGDSCSAKTWGLDITARDTDSGVMRIHAASSSGIMTYYPGFFAGTREEARARYTASCCDPSVTISATDVNGNIASYELNVSLDLEDIDNVVKDDSGLGEWPEVPTQPPLISDTTPEYFTPAAIAAICLGILLFIALVVVIILVVRACLKRRRASRDLPSYSTQRPTRTP